MTEKEAIEQLQICKDLIKQDGQDYLDDRDIPLIDTAIESLNERPTQGYWIKIDVATYRCSKCGKIQIADDVNELNYCCCCGSRNKMQRLQGDNNDD